MKDTTYYFLGHDGLYEMSGLHSALLTNIGPKPWWRRVLNWVEKHVVWPVEEWMEAWDRRFSSRYDDRVIQQYVQAQLEAAYNSAWFGSAHPNSIWVGKVPSSITEPARPRFHWE